MNTQIHPTFKNQFIRILFLGVFMAVVSAVGGSLLCKKGFFVVGHDLQIASSVFVVAALVYLPYQLFNVKCPKCGMKTRTEKDLTQSRWLANCNDCNIAWDLEMGANRK